LKCYYDMLVRPRSYTILERIAALAKRMGYCKLGVEGNFAPSEMLVRVSILKGAKRADIARLLSNVPRGSIPIVDPEGLDAARYASVNKRVLGFIVRPGMERLVDRSTRRLFEERGWGLVVVPLSSVASNPFSRRQWKFVATVMRRAFAYGIDLAFASEAADPLDLWHPMHIVGLAETVDVPGVMVKTWLSSSVSRNLERFLSRGKPKV